MGTGSRKRLHTTLITLYTKAGDGMLQHEKGIKIHCALKSNVKKVTNKIFPLEWPSGAIWVHHANVLL